MGGNRSGYGMDLVSRVASAVSIPVIAHVGAGKPEHVRGVFSSFDPSAVAIASVFHYLHNMSLSAGIDPIEGNLGFLETAKCSSKISRMSIVGLKRCLTGQGITCRMAI